MKLFLKNEKGMTLVELVVTLLLMSIALGSIGAIIPMVQKHYARAEGISYKQGTVTNVETRLQNALGRGTFIFIRDTPNGDYNLGFNEEGQCIEVVGDNNEPIEGREMVIDQISEIKVKAGKAKQTEGEDPKTIKTYTMEYQLIPKDTTMSTLAGGVVMNNMGVDSSYKEMDFKDEVVFSSEYPNKYLVIDFGKERDPVPRTLYERMLQTYHDFFKIRNRTSPAPTNQEFIDAGFVQSTETAGHYANNDIFRNRLYSKWYSESGSLPKFDPGNYVYFSDNTTIPVYKTADKTTQRYVNPYIFNPVWNEEYNKEPQIMLFAGKKHSCAHGNQDWNTSFIFLADAIGDKGEVFGNWYYNKNYNGEKSYIPSTSIQFDTLKKELHTEGGDWEKLVLKK